MGIFDFLRKRSKTGAENQVFLGDLASRLNFSEEADPSDGDSDDAVTLASFKTRRHDEWTCEECGANNPMTRKYCEVCGFKI